MNLMVIALIGMITMDLWQPFRSLIWVENKNQRRETLIPQ